MRRIFWILLIATLLIAAGCGSHTTGPSSGTGRMRVWLTDDPAPYDSVVIFVDEVSVHRADGGDWVAFPTEITALDLLTLRNGTLVGLGDVTLAAGTYTQIRLHLVPGSYVVVDGVKHSLTVPSGLQTGVKIIGDLVVPPGATVDVGIDFDAAHSIHVTGNGRYMMKPVVHGMILVSSGSITGVIAPGDSTAAVYAIAGADTLGSTLTASGGGFTLSLLPAGTYDVAIDAPVSLRDTTITGVGVTAGSTTDLGTIPLSPQ